MHNGHARYADTSGQPCATALKVLGEWFRAQAASRSAQHDFGCRHRQRRHRMFPGIPISRARAVYRLDRATIRHTRESAPPINTPTLECWTPLARNDERARINRRRFQSERLFAVQRFSFATLSRQGARLDRAERHAPCLTPGRQSGSGSTRGDATAPGAQARADAAASSVANARGAGSKPAPFGFLRRP